MNHPQIVPGSKKFCLSSHGNLMFRVRTYRGKCRFIEVEKLLRDDYAYWVPVIAAVAAQERYDEAAKLGEQGALMEADRCCEKASAWIAWRDRLLQEANHETP